MRPVNLLPARYRARTAGSGDSKTTYIALGALALLVLAVFGYVVTANKVSSRNSEIAQTRQQITAAETQAVTLQGFGDFAAVKQARLSAVKSLATTRLDWERLFRELAHVLPAGVWLTGFDGQPASDSATGGGTTGPAGPTLILKGCADSHRVVADVMVRLRELHLADDVQLTKTSAAEESGDGAAGIPGAPPPSTPSDGAECGDYFTFEILVTLVSPAPESEEPGDTVPARLGGGS